MKPTIILIAVVALVALTAASARADWPHPVKWDQLSPRDGWGGASYYNAGTDTDTITADDFLCTETGWITDIEFQGFSNGEPVQSFRVRFWTDVPATDTEESHPGTLLYDETFGHAADSDPLGLGWTQPDTNLYKINIPEKLWFVQEGSAANAVVYWISIQGIADPAELTSNFYWYFRDRDECTWGDDAAFASESWGYDPWWHWGWETMEFVDDPELYERTLPPDWAKSADMCFKLTGIPIPEPAAIGLLTLALLCLGRLRARKS
jgi:hypothetical protein